ncbi:MAG: SDR family oxidoreductase [Leptospiraceae bacterium]|nr:SDR family oxidoreductase [Leptospiraceae bacterium]MCP5512771.1 SDR family oxidoreductase [Leptospiraceae bacterium]
MKKRVLVTGGAGFIGSHICEDLVKKGHDVICLDNYFTGGKENINHLRDFKNFELIRHDVTEEIRLEVDQIYNFACPASPIHYQNNPIKTIKTNVLGTLNMLGLAKRVRARILQASTSEIYGNPLEHPQKEEYWGNVNTIGIRSCYDEGKRLSETLCFDYHRYNSVDIKVIRIFNTYGPRMHIEDGRVVSNFIVQALQNKDITIYGDGSQTRSFCYVDDLLKGIIDMMNTENFIGPVNLGNDGEFTVKELAEMVIRLTGTKSKIIYKALPQDDPARRRPDLTIAREKLNYQITIQLEEGLKKTIAYFDNYLKNMK